MHANIKIRCSSAHHSYSRSLACCLLRAFLSAGHLIILPFFLTLNAKENTHSWGFKMPSAFEMHLQNPLVSKTCVKNPRFFLRLSICIVLLAITRQLCLLCPLLKWSDSETLFQNGYCPLLWVIYCSTCVPFWSLLLSRISPPEEIKKSIFKVCNWD